MTSIFYVRVIALFAIKRKDVNVFRYGSTNSLAADNNPSTAVPAPNPVPAPLSQERSTLQIQNSVVDLQIGVPSSSSAAANTESADDYVFDYQTFLYALCLDKNVRSGVQKAWAVASLPSSQEQNIHTNCLGYSLRCGASEAFTVSYICQYVLHDL